MRYSAFAGCPSPGVSALRLAPERQGILPTAKVVAETESWG